eukprot:5662394-Prymnesium_polylepis.1
MSRRHIAQCSPQDLLRPQSKHLETASGVRVCAFSPRAAPASSIHPAFAQPPLQCTVQRLA